MIDDNDPVRPNSLLPAIAVTAGCFVAFAWLFCCAVRAVLAVRP